jgi:hypothetical protein
MLLTKTGIHENIAYGREQWVPAGEKHFDLDHREALLPALRAEAKMRCRVSLLHQTSAA